MVNVANELEIGFPQEKLLVREINGETARRQEVDHATREMQT